MDMDISPKMAKQVDGSNGGSYHAWCPSELPMLREGNVGAAKLVLRKHGFALPHYSDSCKLAYVLQGSGVAGYVLPDQSQEKVVGIRKGDALVIPFGTVTWWFNKGDAELEVLFLGDTSKAHKRGYFSYFFLAGSIGVFTGFSSEFVERAWDVDESVAKSLVGSQPGTLIVQIDAAAAAKMPEPKEEHRDGLALNCEEALPDVDIKNGGRLVVLNSKRLPLLGQAGFGGDLVRLDGGAMCSPGFSSDSALQVTYVVRGSGRVQVVGVNGKRVLDASVKAGVVFIVPRFCVVSKIADPCGLEWFSIITASDPSFSHLAGRTSVYKALSPEVMEASFNVRTDLEQYFRSKRMSDEIFFPQRDRKDEKENIINGE